VAEEVTQRAARGPLRPVARQRGQFLVRELASAPALQQAAVLGPELKSPSANPIRQQDSRHLQQA